MPDAHVVRPPFALRPGVPQSVQPLGLASPLTCPAPERSRAASPAALGGDLGTSLPPRWPSAEPDYADRSRAPLIALEAWLAASCNAAVER